MRCQDHVSSNVLFLSLKMPNEPILASIYFLSYFSFQTLKTFDCGFIVK